MYIVNWFMEPLLSIHGWVSKTYHPVLPKLILKESGILKDRDNKIIKNLMDEVNKQKTNIHIYKAKQ